MDSDYKIEKISQEEIGKIAHLYEVCFGREMGSSLFKWKYFQSPSGESLLLGVKFNGNIIGSCVMLPEDFCIFGDMKKVYKCADLMVHPGHRKKGLANGLIRCLCEDLKKAGPLFLYTLCSKTATRSFNKNGWTKLGDLYPYFKHGSQLKIESLFAGPGRLYEKGVLRQVGSVSELCRNYKFNVDKNSVSLVKNESYLNWRIGDPRYKYSILGYYEGSVLRGYAIYSLGKRDIAYLIDIEVDGHDNTEAVSALFNAVELEAVKANCRLLIALTLQGSAFQKLARSNYYIRNPFNRGPLSSILDFNILVDDASAYSGKAYDKMNWDILPINYDGI